MFGYQVAVILASTILIPAVIGAIRFRKLNASYKAIVLLFIFSAVVETVMFGMPFFRSSNLFLLHMYAIVEIILLSFFFITQMKNRTTVKAIRFVMILLCLTSLVYSAVGNNFAEFNSIPRAIECVYFSVLACYLFYELSFDVQPVSESIYFVNGAILYYFSSCFIVFGFAKYASSNSSHLLLMHNVHSIVSAMCNLSYATGLWIFSRSSYSAA